MTEIVIDEKYTNPSEPSLQWSDGVSALFVNGQEAGWADGSPRSDSRDLIPIVFVEKLKVRWPA